MVCACSLLKRQYIIRVNRIKIAHCKSTFAIVRQYILVPNGANVERALSGEVTRETRDSRDSRETRRHYRVCGFCPE